MASACLPLPVKIANTLAPIIQLTPVHQMAGLVIIYMKPSVIFRLVFAKNMRVAGSHIYTPREPKLPKTTATKNA